MTLEIYLAYIAACFLIAIIPGPTVTVIIANSLAHGTRAGLLNVAGTQLGLGLMMAILVVGLSSVIAAMGWLFDWLRWAGAAYLIWIGWKLLRSPDSSRATRRPHPTPRGGFLLQGFLVLMANPKALLWFGAFIPQFVDPKGNYVAQIIAARPHRHGHRAGHRRRLRRAHRPRRRAPLAQARPPGLAPERHLPHRRRHLARPDAWPIAGSRSRR